MYVVVVIITFSVGPYYIFKILIIPFVSFIDYNLKYVFFSIHKSKPKAELVLIEMECYATLYMGK